MNKKEKKDAGSETPLFVGATSGQERSQWSFNRMFRSKWERRAELNVVLVQRWSQGFLIEWSWQAGGASLGLLSAESVERPITDTTTLHKCHFPSRGRPSLLPCIMLRAPPEERFIFLNNLYAPRWRDNNHAKSPHSETWPAGIRATVKIL